MNKFASPTWLSSTLNESPSEKEGKYMGMISTK